MIMLNPANYLVIPRAASESWEYLPVAFTNRVTAGSYWAIVPESQLYQFGILNSAMHMAWIKCVAGKLECYDRIHFNPTIKNFPWPISHTQAHIMAIEAKALTVLQVRTLYQDTPFAELYHPATMPTALRNAHRDLDKAVDAAYGEKAFRSDDSRVGFLLSYQRKLASLLVTLSDDPAVLSGDIGYAGMTSRKNVQEVSANVF